MMKLTIKEVAQAKGFKNAKQLTDAMTEHFGSVLSYSTIYPLWDDTAQRFDRSTLDKLCTFLQVPIGMLIQFIDTNSLPQSEPSQSAAAKPRRSTSGESKRKSGAKQARAAVVNG
jgi:DNA-binding Xre family transcriptional regulator